MAGLISIDQFRADLRAKRYNPGDAVFRLSTDPAAEVQDKNRTLRFCFSDGTVDRMGDTINPDGWEMADFLNNPVALWAHNSSAPPIGRASDLAVENSRLMGDIEFAPFETYDFADLIYRLLRGKFLRAVSVGFMPIKYSFVESSDRPWGIDFEKQTLLEISVCPVPANPNALGAARAAGIDTRLLAEWAEKTLDGADSELGRVRVSRAELERLRKAAKEPAMKRGRRADGASEEDPTSGGMLLGNCGRQPDDECGMADPADCAVHAGRDDSDETDGDEKRLTRLLRKVLPGILRTVIAPRFRAEGDSDDDDGRDKPPVAHEDAIRLAHKSMRTARAYMKDADGFSTKAMDHLNQVVDALNSESDNDDDGNGSGDDDTGSGGDDDSGSGDDDGDDKEKAAQRRRAADLRRQLAA